VVEHGDRKDLAGVDPDFGIRAHGIVHRVEHRSVVDLRRGKKVPWRPVAPAACRTKPR